MYNCTTDNTTNLHLAACFQLAGAITWGYTMPTHYSSKAAAVMLDISVSSLRNWCGIFADFLSSAASPAPGLERRLSPADVAILLRVKELRAQGMTAEAIIATLQTEDLTQLSEPYIEGAIAATTPTESPQTPTTHSAPADVVQAMVQAAESRYNALQSQLDAMEQRQADRLTWLIWGFLLGLVTVLIALGILMLGASMN